VLKECGHSIDGASDIPVVIVINTCGFLESSKQESIEAIRDAVRQKAEGKVKRVVVAGCLSQRLGEELARLAPGADTYVGVGQMNRFGTIVRDTLERSTPKIEIEPPHHRWADVETRARSGQPWSAYLKVSEGCDHQCTFCTIPSFRGRHVSKPLERVVQEARMLAGRGVREINLIAQDVTQYGYDLYQKFTLPKLLAELNAIEGIEWIRILYFYPNRLTDEVIETMAGLPRVAKYIDIPLQHTHPDVLRRMKRPWDGERFLRIFDKVRDAMPDVAIRTTFIVGFPGETDAEFDDLLDFAEAARLDRVGAFTYSREPGTPSHDMPNQVPEEVKSARFDELMTLQQQVSLEVNQGWIGRPMKVLVEGERDGWLIGRSHRDAPDIDGLVFAPGSGRSGEFVEVAIEDAEPYDLFGRIAGDSARPRPVTSLRMASPARPA
jgi:ribosomal protein S12 methylthiotransferase